MLLMFKEVIHFLFFEMAVLKRQNDLIERRERKKKCIKTEYVFRGLCLVLQFIANEFQIPLRCDALTYISIHFLFLSRQKYAAPINTFWSDSKKIQ